MNKEDIEQFIKDKVGSEIELTSRELTLETIEGNVIIHVSTLVTNLKLGTLISNELVRTYVPKGNNPIIRLFQRVCYDNQKDIVERVVNRISFPINLLIRAGDRIHEEIQKNFREENVKIEDTISFKLPNEVTLNYNNPITPFKIQPNHKNRLIIDGHVDIVDLERKYFIEIKSTTLDTITRSYWKKYFEQMFLYSLGLKYKYKVDFRPYLLMFFYNKNDYNSRIFLIDAFDNKTKLKVGKSAEETPYNLFKQSSISILEKCNSVNQVINNVYNFYKKDFEKVVKKLNS